MKTKLASIALLLTACSQPQDPKPKPKTTNPTGTATATGTGTGTGTGSGTGTGTGTTAPDCSGGALGWSFLDIDSSEDFTTATDGMLYGVSTSNQALIRSDYDGNAEILAPNVSTWGRGTRFLPGGDLVVAVPDDGTVKRFDPTTWSSTTIASGLAEPNGIAIGDDGMVYLTQMTGRVVRIDPDTQDVRELYDTPVSTDGITFAPDYRTLYWNSEGGEVIKAEIDSDGYVIDGPDVHAQINSGGDLLDGMTSDACGNLYVVRMGGFIIRVFPDGNQELFADVSGSGAFISAVNFGSGYGGFEETNLYVMNLSGGVIEIETDIPRNWEPHL